VLKVTLDDTSLDPDEEEIGGGMLWADYEHLHENPSLYSSSACARGSRSRCGATSPERADRIDPPETATEAAT